MTPTVRRYAKEAQGKRVLEAEQAIAKQASRLETIKAKKSCPA